MSGSVRVCRKDRRLRRYRDHAESFPAPSLRSPSPAMPACSCRVPPKVLATGRHRRADRRSPAGACWKASCSLPIITLAETGVLAITVLFGDTADRRGPGRIFRKPASTLGPVGAAGEFLPQPCSPSSPSSASRTSRTWRRKHAIRDARRRAPSAGRFAITVLIYVAVSVVSVLAPDRAAITGSSAPMSVLFTQISGPGRPPGRGHLRPCHDQRHPHPDGHGGTSLLRDVQRGPAAEMAWRRFMPARKYANPRDPAGRRVHHRA